MLQFSGIYFEGVMKRAYIYMLINQTK